MTKYMTEEDIKEFEDSGYQLFDITTKCLIAGRPLLFICALKKRELCQLFFYYETLIQIFSHFMPQNTLELKDMALINWTLVTQINLCLFIQHIRLSVFATVLMSYVSLFLSRLIVFKTSLNILMEVLPALCWIALSLVIIYFYTRLCHAEHTKVLFETISGS